MPKTIIYERVRYQNFVQVISYNIIIIIRCYDKGKQMITVIIISFYLSITKKQSRQQRSLVTSKF